MKTPCFICGADIEGKQDEPAFCSDPECVEQRDETIINSLVGPFFGSRQEGLRLAAKAFNVTLDRAGEMVAEMERRGVIEFAERDRATPHGMEPFSRLFEWRRVVQPGATRLTDPQE